MEDQTRERLHGSAWRLISRALGICCVALACVGESSAAPDVRVALVIGNASYVHVPRLDNPANDAKAMAALLAKVGFDVTAKYDLKVGEMDTTMADFARKATDADVALIFFAGHGMAFEGDNYLIGVDARLVTSAEVDAEAVSVSDMKSALRGAWPKIRDPGRVPKQSISRQDAQSGVADARCEHAGSDSGADGTANDRGLRCSRGDDRI